VRLYGDGANSGLQEGRRRLLERSYRHRTHRLRSWLTPVFRPVPIDQRAQNDELKKTKKTLSPNLSVLPNGTVSILAAGKVQYSIQGGLSDQCRSP
jgi:hypothetical protein